MKTADIEIEGHTLQAMELHSSLDLTGVVVTDAHHLRLFKSAFNAGRLIKLDGASYRVASSYPAEFGNPDTFYLYPMSPVLCSRRLN